MVTLSVVIPAYNEEHAILGVLDRVMREKERILSNLESISDVEVIVVDDGSKDRTADLARTCDGVRVISHGTNRGYGAALKTGFERARGAYLAFLDADGTYPPECLVELCRAITDEDRDMAIGTRMSGTDNAMPLLRRMGNKAFATLLSWIVEERITDTASGMRVFKASIYTKLLPLPDGLDFIVAMSTRALHEELKIAEVPIHYEERAGQSKLSVVRDGFRFLGTILSVARLYNPLKFFGVAGLSMLVLGTLLGIQPVLYYLAFRRVEDWEIYRLITTTVLIVTSMNLITFGIASNFILSIMHGNKVRARRRLSRLLLDERFLARFGVIGGVLILASIVLNYQTVLQYISTGKINVHWSYVLTGAFLFLVGSQLIILSFLTKALEELADRVQLFSPRSAGSESSPLAEGVARFEPEL